MRNGYLGTVRRNQRGVRFFSQALLILSFEFLMSLVMELVLIILFMKQRHQVYEVHIAYLVYF